MKLNRAQIKRLRTRLIKAGLLNIYKRTQTFSMKDCFPNDGTVCACGCGVELWGRRTRWASQNCTQDAVLIYSILRGNTQEIRRLLWVRDMGKCSGCNRVVDTWEADHILGVAEGGGGCWIDGYQTLCRVCHREKTKSASQERSKKPNTRTRRNRKQKPRIQKVK